MLLCILQSVIHVAGAPLCALQNAFPAPWDAALQSADVSRIAHHSTCTLQNAFPAPRDAVLQFAERRPGT
jgi:hypothetical protein